MPDPITPPKDDTVEDDPIEVSGSGAAPTLDQVHDINQAHVENEDEEAAEAEAAKAKKDGGEEEEPEEPETPEDEVEEPETPEEPEEPAAPVVEEPAKPAEEAAAVDVDITKNGAGKVAIKDADGNTFYFNNLEEVPDDFEPASYKSLMVGTKALLVKEQNDEKAAADAKVSEEQAAHVKATEDMQAGWESDATSMVRAGQLPNDPKKLEAAKNEVYDYIESELQLFQKTDGKQGSIQTSFSTAYKNMMYDKGEVAKTDKQKEIDDAKKKRGSIVQGGSGADASGGSSNTRGNKVIEAPPAGVGLDAVHARAISQL